MAEEQKTTKVDVEPPAVVAPVKEPTPVPVEASKDVAEEKIHTPPPTDESKALAVVESKLPCFHTCFVCYESYDNSLLMKIDSCFRLLRDRFTP